MTKGISYLVFAEGLNKCYIDIVDGDAENHNNHILEHSFGESVSIDYDCSLIGGRHTHLSKTKRLTSEKHGCKYVMC